MKKFELYKDTRFMIVDDMPDMRADVKDKLTHAGFNATCFTEAEDGQDALEKAQAAEEDIEFFIVDMVMPRMSGIEFITAVRQEARYKYTPILVLSAENDYNIIMPAVKAGANNYMVKPPNLITLAQKLIKSALKANNAYLAGDGS